VSFILTLGQSGVATTQHQLGFLTRNISRFEACVECLIDQRSEFKGKFQNLLNHALIDHRQTLRDDPQADGLVERMVHTCKKGFWNIYFTRSKKD
jgi:transposase